MVCFEVLDYDSLTHVTVGNDYKNVVALIYKKITISHSQTRTFALSNTGTSTNCKGDSPDTMPLAIQKTYPAVDNFSSSGSRKIEYILCLLVGEDKYTISLGEVSIVSSSAKVVSGKNVELIEDGYDPDFPPDTYSSQTTGPAFAVTGDRLYGASINCGKELVTFSYDIDSLDTAKGFNSNVNWMTDSPLNLEDTNVNDMWIKKNRVVGVMNYSGIYETKEFDCSNFPDKIMAVGYGET